MVGDRAAHFRPFKEARQSLELRLADIITDKSLQRDCSTATSNANAEPEWPTEARIAILVSGRLPQLLPR